MYDKIRRLKQVATTFNIGTATIVDYLSAKGFDVENKPTTKITAEQFNILAKRFAFSMQDKVEAEELNIGRRPTQSQPEPTIASQNLTYKTSDKHSEIGYKAIDFITDNTPKILYKYRCWGQSFPFHKRMINNNEIFFSSPNKFNDPFDVNIPFRFDLLSGEEKKQYCLELASQIYPQLNLTNKKQKALEIEKLSFQPLNSEASSLKVLKEFRENVGVVSLSKNKSNILMWSHYADSHKGICIGFNTKKLLQEVQCRLNEIVYSIEYPILKYVLGQSEEVVKQLVTKSNLWSYEEEFRLIKGYFANKPIELSNEAFEEIIIGCQMSKEDKRDLIKILRKKFKYIKILEAIQDKNKFELNFLEI